MSGDFLDSNIFVYVFDDRDRQKQERALAIVRDSEERGAVVSYQVLQETLNVLTTKMQLPLGPGLVREMVEEFLLPLWRVNPSLALFEQALEIRARYGYAFYDALIIAAALDAGCDRLLSEDLQHGQVIEGLRIENPFLAA